MPIRPALAMRDPVPRPTSRGAHVHGSDGAGSVDQLIARVADRLGDAHPQLPQDHLQRMAEEVVLDTVRFVLHWVESPASGSTPYGDTPDDDEPTPPPSKPCESVTSTDAASSPRRPRRVA